MNNRTRDSHYPWTKKWGAAQPNPSAIPPAILAEMQEPAERAAHRLRDPEDMRRACERMDRMREELRQKIGETDIAVELIREARDQE